jgi:hypothetical protein
MLMLRTLLHILPWFGYPIALYRNAAFQRAIKETLEVKQSLEKAEQEV